MSPKISSKARLGKRVRVGEFSVVHDDVEIGDDCVIDSHCVIGKPSDGARGRPLVIGPGSVVRSHSVFYAGSTFGPGLQTGHAVLAREGTSAGAGLQIGTQTDIEGRARFGDFVRIHSDVHISTGSEIGDFAFLYPRVQFTNDAWPPTADIEAGPSLGPMSVVCTQALLFPGVRIGLGSFVAAGSVVRRDIPDISCASGSPATVFCRLDKFFHPVHGAFHPWIRRNSNKYPPAASAKIESLLSEMDRALKVQPRNT